MFFIQILLTDIRVQNFVGDLENYLDVHPINIPGTWATEVDIYITAIMLRTHIYIYSDQYKSWQLFEKDGEFKSGVKCNEDCIYIAHVNGSHYKIVTDTT